MLGFFSSDHDLFLEAYPSGSYAFAWPHSQALAALLGALRLPGRDAGQELALRDALRCCIRGLERYRDRSSRSAAYQSAPAEPLGAGGDLFNDDNCWIALALLDWFDQCGEETGIDAAVSLFEAVTRGWDRDGSKPLPGGIFWGEGSADRNTVSTAAAAQLGLRLFLLRRDEGFLRWSVRMYDWVEGSMSSGDGLYWDHVDRRGRIDDTRWSYNQGLMIGAGCLLKAATGDDAFLESARRAGEASVAHYRSVGWQSQPPVFNAILHRNLMQLDEMWRDAPLAPWLENYGELLREQIDVSTGLLAASAGEVRLLAQAGAVQLLSQLCLCCRREE
jgi:hypothetical protein